jgi:hypothetical protein
MPVTDSNYRLVYVDVGSYEEDSDSTIFQLSTLWTSIQINMLELPSERPLWRTEDPNVTYFFVGDEEFALNTNILEPFAGFNLSVKKTKSIQLSLVQSMKVRGMCFWNFEQ